MNEHELHSVTKEKDEYHPMQIPKVVPRILKRIQTSVLQSYMRYGIWVARNPALVLCSSLGIVLLFCVGLIYFKVETRPEKVIHYELPSTSEIFVHRSGRTGRAGKKGSVILVHTEQQSRSVKGIERDVGCRFIEVQQRRRQHQQLTAAATAASAVASRQQQQS